MSERSANEAVQEPSPEPVPPSPKADPETLVLRGRPAPVVRFKRSAVVVLGALAAGGVAASAWLALKPPAVRLIEDMEGASEPARAPADALETLPPTYADAPRLGPPLPGDLGGPILEHQRSLGSAGADEGAGEEERAAQAERERIAAEIRSARQSGVLVRTDGSREPALGVRHATREQVSPASIQAPAKAALEPVHAKETALVTGGDIGGDINPHRMQPAPSSYLLAAGSVIAASLINGLRSDLPGLVIAQVTERVYDSPTGRLLLIPQGARLVGRYDSTNSFGQSRALVVWQRIVFPDGRSLRLDDVPATDAAGQAGLADEVDFHTGQLLKGAVISTLLGVGAGLAITGESDLVRAMREAAQQNVSRAGDQLVSRGLQIHPTITVRPGTPVRLVVHRDLVIAPPTE